MGTFLGQETLTPGLLSPQGHLHDRYGQLVNVYTKLLLTKISFHLKVVAVTSWGWGCGTLGFSLSQVLEAAWWHLLCPNLDLRGHRGCLGRLESQGTLRHFPPMPGVVSALPSTPGGLLPWLDVPSSPLPPPPPLLHHLHPLSRCPGQMGGHPWPLLLSSEARPVLG